MLTRARHGEFFGEGKAGGRQFAIDKLKKATTQGIGMSLPRGIQTNSLPELPKRAGRV